MRWLSNRIAFMVCSPFLTLAGAATTVLAPMLLDAASFTRFALLSSVFTYLSEFDLGLARLSDRLLPHQVAEVAVSLTGSLLFVRYCIAILLLVLVAMSSGDPLMLVAGAGGIAMLLGNGPLSYYRSRSDTAGFAFSSLLLQFGMTLPRLAGLLIDGVRGSMIGVGLWTGVSCVILNAPLLSVVRVQFGQLPEMIARSLPLFLYNAAWLLYLFANRWVSWWISDSATDAGLFAFGANLTVVGVGVVATLSQVYYPQHLANPKPLALSRELYLLLLVGAVGCICGNLLCRHGLSLVFPHFAAATSTTGALMFAALPLGLSAWLVPLVIARSSRPAEVAVFPVCLVVMYGLMSALNAAIGIAGQAWACFPPGMILFGVQLALVAHRGLLSQRDGIRIWTACFGATCLGLLIWRALFL